MKTIIFTNKHGNKFRVDNVELAEAVERYRPSIGLDARWLPEYLEGADTRQVSGGFDNEGNEYFTTEYLHPAEYTYEIIEESLDVIKASKLAELSEVSLQTRRATAYGEDYRVDNAALGIYDVATVAKIKDVHLKFRNNFYRLKAIVDACTTESEVNAIVFSLE